MTTKKCGRCDIEKNIDDFYAAKGRVRNWCRECDKYNTIIRQRIFKELCVEYKGGKCEKCGYDKYIGALEFHHRDPSKKHFAISRALLRKFDQRVTDELDKCDMLCANCHAEEHKIHDIDELKQKWAHYEKQKQMTKTATKEKNLIASKCDCGRMKSMISKQCVVCVNKKCLERSVEEVVQKIKETNFIQAGKYFGVTDNTLRKFLRKRGIDPKTLK